MDKNYKSIGERIIDNGYFMRDDRLAGKDDGRYDIRNIIDMFSKGIELPEKISDEDRGSLSSVEEIFQEDSPYTEDAFGSSEGFTLSPLTMIRRYLAEKELKRKKKGLANGGMTNMLGTGGITGNKTYHQYHDQFVPMDSESMGYMNGGGIGTMMQPRQNFARGGGADYIGLNPNDTSIQIEDLTETDNNGNFLISAADALPDQTGTISSMPTITNRDLRTIEGSLIDGDDPSSRYAVQQDFPSTIDRFSNSVAPVPPGVIPDRNRGQIPSGIMSSYTQPSPDYPDMIRNPENFPNRLQNLERFQDNRFSDLEFQEGFNFKDAPNEVSNLSELYQNRNFIDNPRRGFFDKTIMSKGNSDASLVNKIKQGSNGIMDFISNIPTPLNLVRNMMNPDPKAPSYKTYSPNIDYSKLNTVNLNDFYDDNPLSDTYGTTRFDRAKKGSFGSFRTLADYFNRNKSIVDTGKKAAADKKAQDAIKAAEARQAVLDARQAAADRSRQSYNPGNIGGGSYRSDRDNSRDGGYGGSSKRSADNRSSDLGFSDIRLKDNIELVGKSPSDINIYNFTCLNDPKVYQGVMAQEVPWASVKHNSGYLMVDYNKVDVDFKSV